MAVKTTIPAISATCLTNFFTKFPLVQRCALKAPVREHVPFRSGWRGTESVSVGFPRSQQVPTGGPILIFRNVPYLETCAALEQIDAGNAHHRPFARRRRQHAFHSLAVAVRAECPRVPHSALESLQTARHEIARIDMQLSREICLESSQTVLWLICQKAKAVLVPSRAMGVLVCANTSDLRHRSLCYRQ